MDKLCGFNCCYIDAYSSDISLTTSVHVVTLTCVICLLQQAMTEHSVIVVCANKCLFTIHPKDGPTPRTNASAVVGHEQDAVARWQLQRLLREGLRLSSTLRELQWRPQNGIATFEISITFIFPNEILSLNVDHTFVEMQRQQPQCLERVRPLGNFWTCSPSSGWSCWSRRTTYPWQSSQNTCWIHLLFGAVSKGGQCGHRV